MGLHTKQNASSYDRASSATSVLLFNLAEEVASGYPLVGTTSTTNIGGDAPVHIDAGHPPQLSEEPSDLSKSSRTATLNDSRLWAQNSTLGLASHGLSTLNSSASLGRQNTILASGSSPYRKSRELKIVLGDAKAKLKRNSSLAFKSTNAHATDLLDPGALYLEGSNPHARVQLDLILEGDTYVQGGHINGLVLCTVRKKGDELVMLSDGRMRVVGFESIMHDKERAVFYECSVPLSSVSQNMDTLYCSGPNDEGFMLANEGQLSFPFSMHLEPEATSGAPKGSFPPHSGVALRYILMTSIRIKDPLSEKISVAHFYRYIRVWPRLDLAFSLTPLPRPIQVIMSGIEGGLKFGLFLRRLQWVAGQQCHLELHVANHTSKSIKSLSVELHRDTITYRPRGDPAVTDDFGEAETSTTSKTILASTLSAGDRAEKGYVSTKGWWTGVLPGESLHFNFSLLLPSDALSVTNGQLLEIEHRVKATISTGSLLPSELSAEVPIRIINFISIDPPPDRATNTPALMSRDSAASNYTLPGPPYSDILAGNLNPGSGALQRENGTSARQELAVPPPMTGLGLEGNRSDAARFADLYYKTLEEHPTQPPNYSRSYRGFNDLPTGKLPIPNDPPEMNLFPISNNGYSRAIPSTRDAETGFPIRPSISVGGVLPPSMLNTHIPSSDRTQNGSSRGLNTLVAQKNFELDTFRPIQGVPSRKLPEPPSVPVDVPETIADKTMNQQTTKLAFPLRNHETPPRIALPGMRSAPSTTSLPLSPGAVSVKDKIRELEERVKAIEYSAAAPV